MSKFIFTPCSNRLNQIIPNLYTVWPTVFGDSRGYFMETYNEEFAPYIRHFDGSPAVFIQDNESHSRKGVLRGLHFQKTKPQAKLVRVITGEVYDVVVDLRNDSPTFGSYYGIVLSGENKWQLFIPEGFAHGFLVLSDSATFVYKCTRVYAPDDEGGLLWNDPDVGINWPMDGIEPQLSDKDKNNPGFQALRDSWRF
jgi:dTDP-4-dehydrorhamnose 3,5-epimerase